MKPIKNCDTCKNEIRECRGNITLYLIERCRYCGAPACLHCAQEYPRPCCGFKGCVVYFIQETGGHYIKISTSRDLQSNYRSLYSNTPHDLNILLLIYHKEYILQGELHERFKEHRHRGKWFKEHLDIYGYIHSHFDTWTKNILLQNRLRI